PARVCGTTHYVIPTEGPRRLRAGVEGSLRRSSLLCVLCVLCASLPRAARGALVFFFASLLLWFFPSAILIRRHRPVLSPFPDGTNLLRARDAERLRRVNLLQQYIRRKLLLAVKRG